MILTIKEKTDSRANNIGTGSVEEAYPLDDTIYDLPWDGFDVGTPQVANGAAAKVHCGKEKCIHGGL